MSIPLEGARAGASRTRAPVLRPDARRAITITVALLLATGLSTPIGAQTPASDSVPLSLQGALDAAQSRSRALAAQDAAARSAREQAVAAGRLPDPMLHLSLDNLPVDGPQRFSLTEDFMTMRSVALSQTFVRADKRRARAARFEREAESAQAARAMQLAQLRRGTALAWFDRYYQQQMVALLSQQRDEAALQIDAADAAYRASRGAQAEVFMARSSVAGIDDRIRAAQAREANAATTLARWVGDRASAPLGEPPPLSTTRLAAHRLVHQLERHPDVALLASKETVALADAEIARQERRVDWSASLMYSQRGPAFSNMVSIAVSVPLQWDQKNRQDRELAARLAQAEQARAEREEMTRAHLAETERWLTSWRSHLARLADYDATLIPLAAERTRAALAAYRGGGGALAAVLEARRMEIDTRVERLRIEMETAGLWIELEYLIPDEGDAQDAAAAPPVPTTNLPEQAQ